MVKKFGVIFAVLLVVLLLSNTNYSANNQVLAQNASGIIDSNVTQTPTLTPSPSTTITKLTGGVKINSPDKGDLVPLNSNKSLVINGISKDNASSDCDVTIIVNNVKPYQNVQPTGIQGNNDYSTWQYTLASNYTSINEGNNKITSKIYCAGIGGSGGAASPQAPSQAYYSVNITASNFTQAQLTNYELMLESASNSTNGNSTLASNGIQPVAQIQQFNQDTGSGPICCKTTSALTTQSSDSGTGSSSSSNDDDDDDNDNDNDDSSSSSIGSSSSIRNDDDDDDNDNDNDDSSSSSSGSSSSIRNDDDDDDNDNDNDDSSSSSSGSSSSIRNDDDDDDSSDFSSQMNDFDFGFDFDTDTDSGDSSWSGDSGDDSGVDSILDDVEDTMRSAGLDFSFS